MGVRPIWILGADAIGYDAFIRFWQTISANEDLLDERNRVTIPTFDTYLRYQRNQVIRSLASQHSDAKSLCEDLREKHSIELSLSAVKRVLGKMHR